VNAFSNCPKVRLKVNGTPVGTDQVPNPWNSDASKDIVGEPASYHAPGDPNLNAEGGLRKVAVRSMFTPGTVTVTATSPGLGTGTTTFTTVAPPVLKAPVAP
jgi:hypothetical protein